MPKNFTLAILLLLVSSNKFELEELRLLFRIAKILIESSLNRMIKHYALSGSFVR